MTSHLPSPSASTSRIQSQVQGDHFVIADGQFNQWNVENSITHIIAPKDPDTLAFERLQETVATAAFHNSAQRVDAPKCHPNTRTAVMERIMDWIMSRDDRDAWIMWLHGAAGAGKSAIAQSIAELCVKRGVTIASFFFFRTDPTRNNIRSLVATLAYQLVLAFEVYRYIILPVITHDPLIFDRSLEHQFELLIVIPMRQLRQLSNSNESRDPPLLFLIDGLDECNDRDTQITLIRTFSDISTNQEIPLLFLVASRPESHLTMAFNSKKCTSILTRLALDNKYLPDDDILLFLNEKFAEITDTHPRKHLLDPAWPPRPNIDEIVEKSSGQFIYAAVVMNYISSPRGHPAHCLEVCRGLRPARSDTPFAQLDALYQHIFSQVRDMDAMQQVLAMALYAGGHVINPFVDRQDMGSVESYLSDLTSVIYCGGNEVKFLHASLPDFLGDPERSGEYYMDPGVWCAYLTVLMFGDPKYQHVLGYSVSSNLLRQANPTPELQSELVKFVPTNYLWGQRRDSGVFDLLSTARTMNFNDGGETYRRFFSRIAPYVKTNLPHLCPKLKDLAPVSQTMRSKLMSIFPGVIEEISSSNVGRKDLKKKKKKHPGVE